LYGQSSSWRIDVNCFFFIIKTEIVPTNRHTEASARIYRAHLSASLTPHSHPTGSLSIGLQSQHSRRLNVDKTPPHISRLSD
jgi:hypothetical protein